MSKKYDYFDEQSDQFKQEQQQIAHQMEQVARDQARDSLKRMREVSRKMAEIAEKDVAAEGATAAGVGGGTATGVGAGTAAGAGGASAGAGASAGGGAAGGGAGAGATGAGVGAGTASTTGVAAGWKIILIILIIVLVIIILYFLISGVIKLANNVKESEQNPTTVSGIPQDEQTYNNAEYVLKLIEGNYLSLEADTTGAFDNDYAKQVLEAVIKEKESRGEHIKVRYEGKPWVLVEDANGKTLDDLIQEIKDDGGTPGEYYVDDNGETFVNKYGKWQEAKLGGRYLSTMKLYTILSRRDIETTSFTSDYFDDPYELRWQPVYVLCQMRIANVVDKWGLSETDAEGNPKELTVEEVNANGVGDYFLKDTDIRYCIDCFQPKFRYTWNPIEEGLDGTEFTYDDDKMLAYLERDQRDMPSFGGTTALGGRCYVYHQPTIAASSIDLGYRKILFNITDNNGTYKITSRTIKETPEEWMEKLNTAAGGYFSKEEFLYLLEQLPGTEDMVDEYRAIFESSDSQREDLTVDGCVGAIIKDEVRIAPIPGGNGLTTGLNVEYTPVGESVILEFRDCYINQGTYMPNATPQKTWGRAPRGDGKYTIGGAGCIDCCYAMCCHYFNGTCIPMEEVSTVYVKNSWDFNKPGQAFWPGYFCPAFRIGGYSPTDKTKPIPIEKIKQHLQAGNPVIMQVKGTWTSSSGRTLHGGSNTHYIVIYGYDDEGLYLADPGNGANSTSEPISYEDMNRAPIVDNAFVTSKDPGFVPSFAVNTLKYGDLW